MIVDEFVQRFDNPKPRRNGQYMVRCPCHDDKKNSLGIKEDNGKIVLKCLAGCETARILDAVGATWSDLFVERRNEPICRKEEYIYASGRLRKIRYYRPDGDKAFYWQHYANGKWEPGRNNILPGLYCSCEELPETVFLVEGEKDVHSLKRANADAVSLPDGSGSKWDKGYETALEGKQIIILPDNDKAGRKYAQMCAENLYGKASDIFVLDLKTAWSDIPEKGDVSDLLAHFGAEEGMRLLGAAMTNVSRWEPKKVEESNTLMALFKPLSEFEEEETDWLIPGWVPAGQIVLVVSDGGVGKTSLWVDIVAALSNGQPCILDPEGYERDSKKTIFLSAEDSVRKKLKKKLRLAGANQRNVLTPDNKNDTDGLIDKIKFGSPEMEQFIRYYKPDLCVLDPVQGFIPPEVNMASRNAMRNCLSQLVRLGEEVGTTFIVICHSNKRKGASGRNRVADSADLWDIARSVIMAGHTGENDIRYLSNEKNNYDQLQETVLFTINAQGQVVKHGKTWKRDKDFMRDSAFTNAAPKREDCKQMVLDMITKERGQRIKSQTLHNKLVEYGYSEATIRRALEDLKKSMQITYSSTGAAKLGTRVWYVGLTTEQPASDSDEYPVVAYDQDELPFGWAECVN